VRRIAWTDANLDGAYWTEFLNDLNLEEVEKLQGLCSSCFKVSTNSFQKKRKKSSSIQKKAAGVMFTLTGESVDLYNNLSSSSRLLYQGEIQEKILRKLSILDASKCKDIVQLM